MLVSAKGESAGIAIFYRVLGKNFWRKWHLSNGLKERRKQVKTIFRRKVFQAEGRTNAKALLEQKPWSRRGRKSGAGLVTMWWGEWVWEATGDPVWGAVTLDEAGSQERDLTRRVSEKITINTENFKFEPRQKKQSPVVREGGMGWVCGDGLTSEAGDNSAWRPPQAPVPAKFFFWSSSLTALSKMALPLTSLRLCPNVTSLEGPSLTTLSFLL